MFNKKVLNQLVEFYGSVLHLRGNETKSQPIEICGNYLLFNGEIYGGISVCSEENDAEILSKLLDGKSEKEFLQILSLIEGEWAFAYYNVALNCVYFGRDFLGKRSLLIHLPENSADSLLISSVSSADTQTLGYWKEVETRGIFKVDLSEDISNLNIQCLEWGIDGLNQPNFNLNPDLSKIDELGVIENEGKQLPNVRTWSEPENAAALDNLMGLLNHSVKCRVTTIPPPLAGTSRLGILFSGGLDCMVLAAFAHKHVPLCEPIDLLNVSFENPRALKCKPSVQTEQDIYNVPDRITGKLGFNELSKLYPDREWRFVEINVPYSETLDTKAHILELMHPLETVMDLSIAIAFWFAAKGVGKLYSNQINHTNSSTNLENLDQSTNLSYYNSKAKVLLSGLGADEQLGGYSRHRKAFENGGWEKLVNELSFDVSRISTRNLGRDDRIISDHGKEIRFPYLDTAVMGYLSSLPIYIKTDPRYTRAIGDKILLRQLARELGLSRASVEAKRAVQFGSKTAKMELSAQKGHEHF